MNCLKGELLKGLMLIGLMLICFGPAYLGAKYTSTPRRPTEEVCKGWSVGNIVKLKIGSPKMTVVDLWQYGGKCHLEVAWTNSQDEAEVAKYPVIILEK